MAMLAGENDITIKTLFDIAFPEVGYDENNHRTCQQRLGGIIANINIQLKDSGRRIVPGNARRTYRLTILKA